MTFSSLILFSLLVPTLRVHRETRALRHKHQHNSDNEQHGQRCQRCQRCQNIAARDHAEITSPKRGGAFASSMTVTLTAHFLPCMDYRLHWSRKDTICYP